MAHMGHLGVDLSSTVWLNPAADARNVIQPSLDTVLPLAVKRHSVTQSEDLFQAQDESGAAKLRIGAAFNLATLVTNDGVDFGNAIQAIHSDNSLLATDGAYIEANGTHATGTKTAINGLEVGAYNRGNGDVTDFRAATYYSENAGSGTVALASVFRCDGPVNSGGGVITEAVGVNVGAVQDAVANWAIRTDGGQVRFRIGGINNTGLEIIQTPGQVAPMISIVDDSLNPLLQLAANGRDWILDTTTGSKIGTSTSQKLGFYNATPVVQQSVAAAATDAATTQTLANSLRTLAIALGLAA